MSRIYFRGRQTHLIMRLRYLPGVAVLCWNLCSAPAGAQTQDAVFTQGPDLNTARISHFVTTLPDGRAVVFGGHGNGFVSLGTAEVLPAGGDAFQSLAMQHTHDMPAFTVLSDGRYLLAGGSANLGVPQYAFSEVYNPADNSFTQVGDMVRFRASAGSAVLSDGSVLVAGAWWTHNDAHTYGELFSPTSGAFSATAAFPVQRSQPLVLPAEDGRAVIMGGQRPRGGYDDFPVNTFDPGTGTIGELQPLLFAGEPGWNALSPMRSFHSQQLADGRYLYLAHRVESGLVSYRLFTFDPQTLAINVISVPQLPDSSTFTLWDHPVVDAARGVVHLLAQVAGSNPMEFRLLTINLASGNSVISETAHFPGYSLMGAAITLLGDGRLMVSGGSANGTNFQAVQTTFYITPPTMPAAVLTINPANNAHAYTAASGQAIAVTANVPWTAAASVSWITITEGVTGANNGTVTYDVSENTGAARSGSITVAGGGITQTCTVNQAVATYTVSYNANGATSGTVPASHTKTHDVTLTLQSNSGNLAKTGHTFVGWNNAADGSGTDYTVGGNYIANAAVTLYAKWVAAATSWDEGSQDIGGGWRRLDWFGDYAPMGGSGWIWHNRHGFFFVPASSTAQHVWLYAQNMGWLYTGNATYPFLYRAGDAAWLWYNGSTNPRWFVNMGTGQWESHY